MTKPTRPEAEALAASAVTYWTAAGAINVGFVTHPITGLKGTNEGWGFTLTGMCPRRGVPLEWVPGAASVWARGLRRRA